VASEEDAAARSTAARSLVVSPIDAIDRRAPIAPVFSFPSSSSSAATRTRTTTERATETTSFEEGR
jgi:hypothetical protein